MNTLKKIGKQVIPIKFQPVSFYNKMRGEEMIMTGPFKGMKYLNVSIGSSLFPKIYGIYEKELHSTINSVSKKGFEKIIVIGGGEGYYAVGLGKSFPNLEVLAFETNLDGQSAILQMANLNSLKNVKVFGECKAEDLKSIVYSKNRNFIIVDIEGGEVDVLNEEVIVHLKRSDVLIEVHDFVDRSIGEKLKARFSKTHKLKEILQEDRKATDLPVRLNILEKLLYKKTVLNWLSESRPERMRWFYFEPLSL